MSKDRGMTPEDKESWKIIRQKRHENNDLFMDWIEASHDCPRCGPLARKMHKQILWHDMDISHATRRALIRD